jgi:hypothetical protein
MKRKVTRLTVSRRMEGKSREMPFPTDLNMPEDGSERID